MAAESSPQSEDHPFIPPPLPAPFTSSRSVTLLAHGAEALLYKTNFLTADNICILKHRPRKTWRHPTLDARLTKHRILSEARILVRARREGVPVPAILALDSENGWLCTEFIDNVYGRDGCGVTVREGLERWKALNKPKQNDEQGWSEPRALLKRIGEAVGVLHRAGFVHGDLTSSNLMLRSWTGDIKGQDQIPLNGQSHHTQNQDDQISLEGQVILIDFGLASMSVQEEDRAVDLYVLERAMGSTHPWLEHEFALMLDGYRSSYKGSNGTLRRLEEVRMRGRKRSMLG